MEKYKSFRQEDPPTQAYEDEKAALEIRAMSLVLSGAIPPYIDLMETCQSVQLVIDNPASLPPQKALMTR